MSSHGLAHVESFNHDWQCNVTCTCGLKFDGRDMNRARAEDKAYTALRLHIGEMAAREAHPSAQHAIS